MAPITQLRTQILLAPAPPAAAPIHLQRPVAAGQDAVRVNYFPQRSLGSAEFGQLARYIDQRLLGVSVIAQPGVVEGLTLTPARWDPGTPALAQISVQPGLGVTRGGVVIRLSAVLTVNWADLAAVWRGGLAAGQPTRSLADGVYFLAVRPMAFETLHGPPPAPPVREPVDPLLDERQDSFVELILSDAIPLTIPLPPAAASPGDIALFLNNVVAGLTPAGVDAATGGAVPLGLIVVRGGQPWLLSQAAGRVVSHSAGLRATLLAQVRETLTLALAEPADATVVSGDRIAQIGGRVRYLPAAGELPLGFLLPPPRAAGAPLPPLPGDPQSTCPFLSPSLEVALTTIRASRVPRLLTSELRRAPIDLSVPTADAVTLLLAIPDKDWRPDLLDEPHGDPLLPSVLFRTFTTALTAQIAANDAWNAVYGGLGSHMTDDNRTIMNYLLVTAAGTTQPPPTRQDLIDHHADMLVSFADDAGDPKALGDLLRSQTPVVTLPSPPDATAVQTNLDRLGYAVQDAPPTAPIEPDVVLQPLTQDGHLPDGTTYTRWLEVNKLVRPTESTDAPKATDPGALAKLYTLQQVYSILAQITRTQQTTLEAHQRLLVLQRQHLDIVSSLTSSLAGGVPGDGTGMQFARLLPFIQLRLPPIPSPPPPPLPPAPPPPAAVAAPLPPVAPAPAAPAASLAIAAPRSIAASITASASRSILATTALTPVSMTVSPSIGQFQLAPVAAAPHQISFAPGLLAATQQTSFVPPTSTVGQLIGKTDVAADVAAQVGAITQKPQFDFTPAVSGVAAHLAPATATVNTVQTGFQNLAALATGLNVPGLPTVSLSNATDENQAYVNLGTLGRGLVDQIGAVQNAAQPVEARYLAWRDRLATLEQRIAAAQLDLAHARAKLAEALRAFAVPAADYASAQQLVLEEIQRVAAANATRRRVLGAPTGLFWVRQRQTAIARGLSSPLPLTADTPSDLVPGCTANHAGPPASVQPFLDWVLELPLDDFAPLRPLYPGMPDRAGLPQLSAIRAARITVASPALTHSATFGASFAAGDLAALHNANLTSFADRLQTSVVSFLPSLADTQRQAMRIFSIPDVLLLPGDLLRRRVEQLRQSFEAACGCLIEKLRGMAPSTRFNLAALAGQNAVDSLSPASWPLTGVTAADEFTAVREITAIIDWMARQLADTPSVYARPALANLVRALLIAAAYGAPDEALSGEVTAPPATFSVGDPVRFTLSRAAPIGTLLDVFDAGQRLVGKMRLEDATSDGASGRLVASYAGNVAPGTQLTVAQSRTGHLLE